MFEEYEIDFGKVNWNWCHSLCIERDEIEQLVELTQHAWLYMKEAGEYEIVGYTTYRKFVVITFTLADHRLVIESVQLPSYESIRDVILRQFLEETN